MFKFLNLTKISAGLTVGGVVVAYYKLDKIKNNGVVHASWTDEFVVPNIQWPKWDSNWDRRELSVHALKNISNNEIDVPKKPKAVRHIILIRHGQYNLSGKTDKERILTDLGRKQAMMTGVRLKELDFPYTMLAWSTMARAIETAKYIQESLPNLKVHECSLLEEGAPIPPEPPTGRWKPPHYFFQDGARIEAAFRKYFFRADPSQEKDSYDVIVCHANVIRYFVCRALQYPPEGWLRMSLRHASITWLSIMPNGRVSLQCYGDAGYMPPESLTS